MRAKLHWQLGRLLLERGELEAALSHARQGQSLALAHLGNCSSFESSKIVSLWDLCGDVLEKMGRLEEAWKSDQDASRRIGWLGVSGRRRSVQGLVRLGCHQVRALS